MSEPLPGPSGTMKRTLRCGQDWAGAADGTAAIITRQAQKTRSAARTRLIGFPMAEAALEKNSIDFICVRSRLSARLGIPRIHV
jgi:hypothetical protein